MLAKAYKTCAILVSSIDQSSWAITAFHASLGVDAFAFVMAPTIAFRTLVYI